MQQKSTHPSQQVSVNSITVNTQVWMTVFKRRQWNCQVLFGKCIIISFGVVYGIGLYHHPQGANKEDALLVELRGFLRICNTRIDGS